MPYISAKDDRREKLSKGDTALTAGELNYQIFYHVKNTKDFGEYDKEIILGFVTNFLGEKPNYQRWNDLTGCLIRCAFEIDRRLQKKSVSDYLVDLMISYNEEINKYEDLKIQENGDV